MQTSAAKKTARDFRIGEPGDFVHVTADARALRTACENDIWNEDTKEYVGRVGWLDSMKWLAGKTVRITDLCRDGYACRVDCSASNSTVPCPNVMIPFSVVTSLAKKSSVVIFISDELARLRGERDTGGGGRRRNAPRGTAAAGAGSSAAVNGVGK